MDHPSYYMLDYAFNQSGKMMSMFSPAEIHNSCFIVIPTDCFYQAEHHHSLTTLVWVASNKATISQFR
jgi:hypothetical protein